MLRTSRLENIAKSNAGINPRPGSMVVAGTFMGVAVGGCAAIRPGFLRWLAGSASPLSPGTVGTRFGGIVAPRPGVGKGV